MILKSEVEGSRGGRHWGWFNYQNEPGPTLAALGSQLPTRGKRVQTSIHYLPLHQLSYYREQYPDVKLPITEDVAAREVTLPLYPTMSDGQVDMVIAAVLSALEGLGI